MIKIKVSSQKHYLKVKLLEFISKQYLIVFLISSIGIFLI